MATFNQTPGTVDDLLSNVDVLLGIQATITAAGITDTGILSAVQNVINAQLQLGATAITADQAARNVPYSEPVSHNGANYEVNTSATPPIIVAATTTPASSIPIPSVTPPVVAPTS